MNGYAIDTAAGQGLATCHLCLKLASAELHVCPRCGTPLHLRKPQSLERVVALLLTAAVLYIPANLLPIMTTSQLGVPEDSTIMGGILLLWHHGSYPIAGVIFVASVFIPLAKMFVLSWLVWSVARNYGTTAKERTTLFKVTEFIGRWSMVDVFVVAILVALIQLGGILVITPGSAALAFAGLVGTTMLAAESFDSRLIWDHVRDDDA
jgi:paraquat-inducible protein A